MDSSIQTSIAEPLKEWPFELFLIRSDLLVEGGLEILFLDKIGEPFY